MLLIISVPPPSVMVRSDDVILVGEYVVVYCDVDLIGVTRGSDVAVDVSWFQDSVPVRTDSRVSISGVTGDEDGGHSSLPSTSLTLPHTSVMLPSLLYWESATPVSSNASLFLSPSECAPVYYNYLLISVRPSETRRHHIDGCQVRQCHHPVDSSLHILLSRDICSTIWH